MFGTVFSFFFYRSPRCVAGFFYFVAVKDFILLLPFLLFTVFLLSASPFSFVCHELFYITSSAFVAVFLGFSIRPLRVFLYLDFVASRASSFARSLRGVQYINEFTVELFTCNDMISR